MANKESKEDLKRLSRRPKERLMNRSIEGVEKEKLIARELEFEKNLVNAFANYDFIKITNQFKIPTIDKKSPTVDFYISSPLRAFIEIKIFGKSITVEHLRHINEQMTQTSALFNDSVLPILIIITEKPLTSKKKFEILEKKISPIFISINESNSIQSVASVTADRIKKIMMMEDDLGKKGITKYLTRKRKEKDWSIDPNKGKIVFSEEYSLLQTKDRIFDTQFIDYVGAFKSALDPDTYSEFIQEFIAFNTEYKSNHYTSAALRLGRILERSIYNLLSSWGVSIDRKTTNVLKNIHTAVNDLEKQVINYTTAEDSAKEKFRGHVKDKASDLTAKLMSLVMDLDNDDHELDASFVASPNALLRDLKKRFGRNEKIRNEIDNILNDDLVERIYKIRLDAAHADLRGKPREVSKKELDEGIELLKILFFRLGNILAHVNQEMFKDGLDE